MTIAEQQQVAREILDTLAKNEELSVKDVSRIVEELGYLLSHRKQHFVNYKKAKEVLIDQCQSGGVES